MNHFPPLRFLLSFYLTLLHQEKQYINFRSKSAPGVQLSAITFCYYSMVPIRWLIKLETTVFIFAFFIIGTKRNTLIEIMSVLIFCMSTLQCDKGTLRLNFQSTQAYECTDQEL